MVRFQRSARVSRGKGLEAARFAKDVAEYINTKYSQRVQVFAEHFGAIGTMYWVADFENLAALEGAMTQLRSDEEYQARIARGADLLIEGSIYDTVLMSL